MTHGSWHLGVLYPGHAAEDDYPALADRLSPPGIIDVVHTPVAVDHHGVDALLDVGSDQSLLAGVQQLRDANRVALAATYPRELAQHFVTFARHEEAEAVLVPDTALRTVPWLHELEARASLPVLTANQVTVWHALRRAGTAVTGERVGRLLSHDGRTGARAPS